MDAILDLFPFSVDFGEVEIGSTLRLEQILFLANGGFGGPRLDVTSARITGPNADAFTAPDLKAQVFFDEPEVYDLVFSPDAIGLAEAMLEIDFETEFVSSGSIGVRLVGRGIPVPEPGLGTCLLLGLLIVWPWMRRLSVVARG